MNNIGHEKFACAPGLRLEAHERLSALHIKQMEAHMARLEAGMARLERRLWLAVFGIVGAVMAEAIQQIMN